MRFENFHSTLLEFSFKQSPYNASLFLHKSEKGTVFLLIYADDIIISSSAVNLIRKLQDLLHVVFHIKDLKELTYFLGLEVRSQTHGLFLNQHKYT